MRRTFNSVPAILMAVCWTAVALAQPAAKTGTAVPRLVKFGGTLTDAGGKPLSGVVGVTFALYEEPEGGAAIWMETQNVQAGGNGEYSALLGATRNEGIPPEVFGAGQRWLGVQPQGEPELPRVLMTSVPYSLKAVDAETLGGLPVSAFVLSGAGSGMTARIAGNSASGASVAPSAGSQKPNSVTPATVGGTGTAGYVPIWTNSDTLGNSAIVQKSGNVGIGISPSDFKLEVATASEGGISGASSNSSGVGVQGISTSSTGSASGVYGASASSTGVGVLGIALDETGAVTGVLGSTTSPEGYGTGGQSSATTGTGSGVLGVSDSPDGNGVSGTNSATTGAATGVYGTTGSPDGSGVQGDANATSGESSGVLGTNSSNEGNGVQGYSSATSGKTTGVYGTADSSSGYGVYGLVSATSGTTIGVYGQADSETGFGVEGQATATSGDATGVYGKAVSESGIGVQGNATAKSGTTFGVNGLNSSTSGTGVAGQSTAETGSTYGTTGVVASTGGIAVAGQALATSGATIGVLGKNSSTEGTAVQGSAVADSGVNWGVVGSAVSAQGTGVYGIAVAHSQLATDLAGTPAGVWGDTKDGTAGVLATSDDGEAIAAYSNATNVATLFVENQEDSNQNSIVLATFSSYGGYCDVFVNGNLTCSGSVGGHAVLKDGSHEVALYAVQSSENWYEDAGSGQLRNGAAVVTLEAEYAQTVNTGVDYKVFLTPNGDCKGLYVTQKSPASFEVHELAGGNSNIAFDYRIMAKRKGFENIRMADITGQIQRGPDLKSRSAVRSAAATHSAPTIPTAPRPHEAAMRANAPRPAHSAKPRPHAIRLPAVAAKPAAGAKPQPAAAH